jgi:hypothetical protein
VTRKYGDTIRHDTYARRIQDAAALEKRNPSTKPVTSQDLTVLGHLKLVIVPPVTLFLGGFGNVLRAHFHQYAARSLAVRT